MKQLGVILLFLLLVWPVSARTVKVTYFIHTSYIKSIPLSTPSHKLERPKEIAHKEQIVVDNKLFRKTLMADQSARSDIENKICKVFGASCHMAIAIALAEHRGTLASNSVGDGGCSIGVFQINSCAHPKYDRDRLFDPDYNIQAAYEIYSSWHSWNAWSVYTNGLYLNYL